MSDNIDNAAQSFSDWLTQAKARLIPIYAALKEGEAGNVDWNAVLMDKLGGATAIQTLLQETVKIAKANWPRIPVDALKALISVQKQYYVGQIGASAAEIGMLVTSAVAEGLPETQFATMLETTGLTKVQANALANDSLRRFQRQIILEHAKAMKETQKFRYMGPDDDKTTPQCREMMNAGALTLKQIQARYPGTFVNGGHFGCRHQWVPVD